MKLAAEMGIGLSFKYADKLMVEFDYTRSDWTGSGVNKISGFSTNSSPFASTMSEAYRLGFELVPNRNDIRYYLRTCAYRAGVYYDQAYYKLDGHSVNSMGLTLGITLPVYRLYNGLTLGIDVGQKSSTKYNMIRERYVKFMVSFNIHDLWFIKNQYQ